MGSSIASLNRQGWKYVSKFADIHCHLLPGIDDGSKNWDDSLTMARQAVAEGISIAVMTPHQLGNYTATRGQSIRDLTDQFQRRLVEHGIPLQVLPGADVRIDNDMIERLQSGDCLTIGDSGRYVLLELPHEIYIPLEPVLERLHAIGMIGVLSHPERNQGILRNPHVIPGLIERGCLMQLTADSVTGVFGETPKKLCDTMLRNGWVHAIATDAHSPRGRRPRMKAAYQRTVAIAGTRYASAVCGEIPNAIAWGDPCPQLPKVQRQGMLGRMFARKAA
jgi:protein-tyrosine phosphatase